MEAVAGGVVSGHAIQAALHDVGGVQKEADGVDVRRNPRRGRTV